MPVRNGLLTERPSQFMSAASSKWEVEAVCDFPLLLTTAQCALNARWVTSVSCDMQCGGKKTVEYPAWILFVICLQRWLCPPWTVLPLSCHYGGKWQAAKLLRSQHTRKDPFIGTTTEETHSSLHLELDCLQADSDWQLGRAMLVQQAGHKCLKKTPPEQYTSDTASMSVILSNKAINENNAVICVI